MKVDFSKIFGVDKEALTIYIDSLREAVMLFDDEGRVLSVNPSCITLFGYDFSSFLSLKPEILFDQSLAGQLNRYFDTGYFSNLDHKRYYGKARRADGSMMSVELSLTIYGVENQNFIMGTIRKESKTRNKDETRLERAFFEQLFETTPEAIVILDDKHNVLRINNAFSILFGYNNDEIVGKPIDELIGREDKNEEAAEITAQVIAGEQVSIETIRYRSDGQPLSISLLGTPITLDGVQIGAVGIYRDITKRKLSEEKIRILARFPSESPDPVLRVSEAGIILYHNKASRGLMQHWKVETFSPLPDNLVGIVRKALSDNKRIDIDQHIGERIYSLRFSPVPRENYVNIYGLDITERKKTEEENAILARFPSENPDPVIRLDRDSRVLYFNEPGRILTNLWNCRIDDPVPENIARVIDNVFESGEQNDIEIKAGNRYISLRFSPVIEAGYVNLYGHDITERKKYEEEQKKLREQLGRAEKMESLGLLAGGVAHDLNNVLGPLVAYPEMIKMQLDQDSPIRDRINKIENSALRAAELVQDLLTMARRGRYEMSPVDLNLIIQNYMASTEYDDLLKRHSMVFCKFNPKTEKAVVQGSSGHLIKVIMNLVLNAYDALPNGGVVEISTDSRQIDRLVGGFDEIDDGRYIIWEVTDNGIGINPEHMKRLFEPFYSNKQMGRSGSGLGLSIVYGVIKDHNGYIDVISKPDQGTRFIIYLPESEGGNDSDVISATPEEIKGSGKILIVDDLEEQRDLAVTVLSNLGYQTVTAYNGHNALDILKKEDFDLLLVDMIMEDNFDGLDTYREILKIKPQQKVIIVSGYSETERVREAEQLGANGYVKKPYTLRKLGGAIREVLNKKSGA